MKRTLTAAGSKRLKLKCDKLLSSCAFNFSLRRYIMECLTAFAVAARQCDMLVTSPIPLSYTRHTSRFLLIWLSLVALPLADELQGFAAVPATFFISMLLLGVEEIGQGGLLIGPDKGR
jgi:predicted membrane chloride channel (bestrophin family)